MEARLTVVEFAYMLDASNHLASDIDWLLQSNQAPEEVILEGLVEEFYPSVYHLAMVLLDSRKTARAVADDVFAFALVERHNYHPDTSAKEWLLGQAWPRLQTARARLEARRALTAAWPRLASMDILGDSAPKMTEDAEIWLAVDALDEPARTAVLLSYTQPGDPLTWSRPAGITADTLHTAQTAARQAVRLGLDRAGISRTDQEIEDLLPQSLRRRWPVRRFSPAQLDSAYRRIARRSAQKARGSRRNVVALEIVLVLLIMGLIAGLNWSADRLFPEPAVATARPPRTVYITAIYITRVRDELPAADVSTPIPTP